jgi:hypothetical protein
MAVNDLDVTALDPSASRKALPERANQGSPIRILDVPAHVADPLHAGRLLRLKRERPNGRPAKPYDELPPSHL